MYDAHKRAQQLIRVIQHQREVIKGHKLAGADEYHPVIQARERKLQQLIKEYRSL